MQDSGHRGSGLDTLSTGLDSWGCSMDWWGPVCLWRRWKGSGGKSPPLSPLIPFHCILIGEFLVVCVCAAKKTMASLWEGPSVMIVGGRQRDGQSLVKRSHFISQGSPIVPPPSPPSLAASPPLPFPLARSWSHRGRSRSDWTQWSFDSGWGWSSVCSSRILIVYLR